MVGKNNHEVKRDKTTEQVHKYSIRKFKNGIASAAIGTLLLGAAANVDAVSAEENAGNAELEISQQAEQPGSVVIQIRDNASNPVANATVELLNEDMTQGRQVVTDDFGNATFSETLPGNYQARLVTVPEGYELNSFTLSLNVVSHETTQDFISVDIVQEDEVEDEEPAEEVEQPGSVVVKVVDNGHNPITNATVELLNEDMTQGRQVRTDEFGNAVFTETLPGNYHARVVDVPEGYVLNTQYFLPINVESHEITEDFIAVDIVQEEDDGEEVEQPGSVVIKVVDNAHNPIANAKVELLNEDMTQGRQVVTDEFGNAVFTETLPGNYHARLVDVPEGYELNAFILPVVVESHEITEDFIAVDIVQEEDDGEEVEQPGSVVIKVVDNFHNPIANAKVELLNEDMTQGRQVVTDEFGNAVFTETLPGNYHARLVDVPEGYELNAFILPVVVESHEITEDFIAVDIVQEEDDGEEVEQPGSVVIKVVDNFHNPIANAKVELLNEDMTQGRQVVTDEFGNAVFTETLPGNYHARLVDVPEGYELNAFILPVVVESHEITEDFIAVDIVQEEETPVVEATYIGGILEVDADGRVLRTIADFTGEDENEVYYELSDRLGVLKAEGYEVVDFERQYDEETGSVLYVAHVRLVEDEDETPETPEEPETPEDPETPETPEDPETPETPEDPETPETPEEPEDPTGEEPEDDVVEDNTDVTTPTDPTEVEDVVVEADDKKLPQTGVASSTVGLGVATLLSGLGLGFINKKRDDE